MRHTEAAFTRGLRTLLLTGAATALVVWGLPTVLAAANTVGDSKSGDGTSTVSGYTASAVTYTLNGTNPQNIDQVDFTVNVEPTAGSTMKVRLVASGGSWYSCTNVATAVSCVTTAPQATVATADELRVVIAD